MTTVYAWLENALKRIYPASCPAGGQTLALLAARNWRVAFQACVRNLAQGVCTAHLKVIDSAGLPMRVRRVGYVPVAHLSTETAIEELEGVGHVPGYVPDPLFPEDTAVVGPQETQAFWITVQVPADVEPGLCEITLQMEVDGEPLPPLRFALDVHVWSLRHARDCLPPTGSMLMPSVTGTNLSRSRSASGRWRGPTCSTSWSMGSTASTCPSLLRPPTGSSDPPSCCG